MMVAATPIQQQALKQVKALKAQGFSRYEIARRLGVQQATVYNWYSGRTGISKKHAERIMASEVQSMKHEMLLPRDYGAEWIQPANWRERSKLGSYWNALKIAKRDDNWTDLKKYEGKYILVVDKGKRERMYFVTDPENIKRLDDEAQLEPIEITFGS